MSKLNKSITVDEANWEYITRLARVNKRSVSGMIDWLISRSREEDDSLDKLSVKLDPKAREYVRDIFKNGRTYADTDSVFKVTDIKEGS